MKPRDFNLRLDLSPEANIRRMQAYIRSIKPDYKPVPKMVHRGNLRAMLRLVK